MIAMAPVEWDGDTVESIELDLDRAIIEQNRKGHAGDALAYVESTVVAVTDPVTGETRRRRRRRPEAAQEDNPKAEAARGKPDWSRVRPDVFEDWPAVMAHGDEKYGPGSWMAGAPWTVYASALLRHVYAWIRGEDLDPDSGLHHLDHAVCNLQILRWLTQNRPDLDDRVPDNG